MRKFVCGLALNETDTAALTLAFMTSEYGVLSTLAEVPEQAVRLLVNYQGGWARVLKHGPTIERLLKWRLPRATSDEPAEDALRQLIQQPPKGLREWAARSAFLALLTGVSAYVVDDLAMRSMDLTAHLMLARAVGVRTVGVIGHEVRTTFDSTQLTFTDVVVSGTVEPRLMTTLVGSLEESD